MVESANDVFLMRQTGLTWGNLATYLDKLEEAGYIEVHKTYKGKKLLTLLRITTQGKEALRAYKKNLKQLLDDLPE